LAAWCGTAADLNEGNDCPATENPECLILKSGNHALFSLDSSWMAA
jgi:hypothetical protein